MRNAGILRPLGFLLVASLCSWSVLGQSFDPRPQMTTFMESKQFAEAYQLGEKYFDEWAGDTKFDFLYGIAARKTNNHQSAIFAFERVIINLPNDIRARVALAIAYFELDNFKASRREFLQVLEKNPPNHVVAQVDRYINLMDQKIRMQRMRLYGSFSAGIGYDDNVSSGLEEGSVKVVLGNQLLFDVPLPIQSDNQRQVNLNLAFDYPITKDDTISISLAGGDTSYSELDDYQKTFADMKLSYNGVFEDSIYSYKLTGSFQPFWLGGEKYQDTLAIMLDNTWRLSSGSSVGLNLAYSDVDNTESDNLDLNTTSIRVSYLTFAFGSAHVFAVGGAADRVKQLDEKSQHNEKNALSLSYRNIWPLTSRVRLNSMLSYTNSKYLKANVALPLADENELPFTIVRNDDTVSASLGADFNINDDWVWNSKISVVNKSSNHPLYVFDKQVITTGVKFKF
ncbi:hypothetical protein C2869_11355 [Saccharobesus litoralis]|uniref:Uncharacterized protein n=1 Tax=Saccharobesus litoralis TaxID=2172099 RepID=A0A2S0VS03_9ALTE|nr:porin family protein [Saccharobesus litoralis]AWB66996.1 hypothetical protein C2869_11355 [Saccharobesus litoralis]